MRVRFILCMLFLVGTGAVAQQPIHVNLLAYFDKIVPPPLSARDAYDKCDRSNEDRINADNLFKALEDELQKMQVEISTPVGSPQADLMKKMQDPEFRKKMESMSEDEKMKFAVQMSQNMTVVPGPMKPEPQAVIKTLQDCSKLSQGSAQDLSRAADAVQQKAREDQELDAKHKAVEDWKTAEIAKLPVTQTGEDPGPDPKAVSAVEIQALKKHLAIVDENLKRTSNMWMDLKSKSKQSFALYESDLEKIHFGDDAKNKLTKTELSGGQTQMIGSIGSLLENTRSVYLDAASWYDRLVQYQKQHQQ